MAKFGLLWKPVVSYGLSLNSSIVLKPFCRCCRGLTTTPCRRQFGPELASLFGQSNDNEQDGDSDARKDKNQSNGNNQRNHKNNTRSSSGSIMSRWSAFARRLGETATVMVATLSVLGLAGLCYHRGYYLHTINKMSASFNRWDPVGELKAGANQILDDEDWITRPHQGTLDSIMAGKVSGRYFVFFGEKGTGKSSMILEAMKKVESEGVVTVEAHADPEIFRIRLGRALNFDFYEDYLGSLFSIRGPRENTAILDIERAFNVLEDVAVQRYRKSGRPLVMIVNNAHLIRDDDEGKDIIELLQQKAESLAGAGLVTMLFNSDDYWICDRLKRLGTRMELISLSDFSRHEMYQALRRIHRRTIGEDIDDSTASAVYNLVGGRAQHVATVARHHDMIKACHELIDREKQWFLSHCALLGEDMDDDVMEYGKFSTAAMLLMREFVKRDPVANLGPDESISLPKLPLWRTRQIMTRADYIQKYDNLNFFTLDDKSNVKPDSVVMMHAFREIAHMPGFEELLHESIDRVAAIESLGRTRELVLKDLIGGRYILNGNRLELETMQQDDDDEGEGNTYLLDRGDRFYWKRRQPKQLRADIE